MVQYSLLLDDQTFPLLHKLCSCLFSYSRDKGDLYGNAYKKPHRCLQVEGQKVARRFFSSTSGRPKSIRILPCSHSKTVAFPLEPLART